MTEQEKKNYIQKLFKESEIFYNKKEYEKALECLDKIIEIDPNNAVIYSLKGVIFSDLEKYKEAVNAYDEAIKLFEKDNDNDKAKAFFNKSSALVYLKKYNNAVDAYNEAIKLFKDNNDKAKAYFRKSLLLGKLNKYNQAIEACNEAAEFYEKKNDKAKVLLFKGLILGQLKKYNEAIKAYDKAINFLENKNKKVKVSLLKGNTLLLIKKYEKAIKEYDLIINPFDSKGDKNDIAQAYLHKGYALQKLNRKDGAIPLFEKTIHLSNNNLNIALGNLKLKNWKETGKFFAKTKLETIEIILFLEEEDEKAHTSDIVCSLLKNNR